MNDVFAAGSAAIALGALVVAYLARKDSKQSALAAQRAADLMERQLELSIQNQNLQIKKTTAESLPHLAWISSGPQGDGQYFEFQNHGSLMTNVRVATDNGLEAAIEPKDVISQGQKARLKINIPKSQQVPNFLVVSIEFADKLNDQRKIHFKLLRHSVGKYFIHPPELA